MSTKEAQNPLILHYHRLMEAFSKSDDERDFYLDKVEGFILYVDLNKDPKEITILETEVRNNPNRYFLIPKLTFYETKKIMEGFVNEKVFDIDTKEKLMDIIGSKMAREHFLEFIHDHHMELEKWQLYYQERFRIRIIEWLRSHEYVFVFEEDLDLTKNVIEKLKRSLFQAKVGKDVASARQILEAKCGTYYSNEALNPRPKRGRPPKQVAKVEVEARATTDIFLRVPASVHPFLFTPELSGSSSVTFSSKFESEEELLASIRTRARSHSTTKLEDLNEKLQSLRALSNRFAGREELDTPAFPPMKDDDEDEDGTEFGLKAKQAKAPATKINNSTSPATKKPKAAPKKVVKESPEKTVSKKDNATAAKPKKAPAKPKLKKLKTIKKKI
jgi:hypothetical protein